MSVSVQLMRKMEGLDPALKEVFYTLIEELQNTVTKTEFNELKQVMQDLAVKVGELITAQKEIAEAQKRTEVSIRQLTKEQREMKEHMTGLGFYLENQAYKHLPLLLKRDFGIEINEGLKRKHIKDKEGNYIEVNIIGKGLRDGEEKIIIGESKHRLSENKINSFIKKVLKRLDGVFKEKLFPIMITYMTSSLK